MIILYIHRKYSFISSLGPVNNSMGLEGQVLSFIIMPLSFPFLCIRIPISGNLQLAYILVNHKSRLQIWLFHFSFYYTEIFLLC